MAYEREISLFSSSLRRQSIFFIFCYLRDSPAAGRSHLLSQLVEAERGISLLQDSNPLKCANRIRDFVA